MSAETHPPSGTSEGKGPSSGGGIGEKLKGAAQVVHGLGETIRGTTLSTADTMTHTSTGEAKNEQVAARGKQEIAEGMSKIKGQTTHGAAPAGTATATGAGAGIGAETHTQGEGGAQPQPEIGQQPAQRTTATEQGVPQGAEQKEELPRWRREGLIGEGADAPGGPGTRV